MAVFATVQFDLCLNLATIMPVPADQGDTQTDSESLEEGVEYTNSIPVYEVALQSTRDEPACSSPSLDRDNANEILTAAVDFLEKLTNDEANVG